MEVPYRVSFNFISACNMRCGYCYIPFSGKTGDISLWIRIILRLHDLGIRSITFGGGDPLNYKGFRDLLRASKGLFDFVQVDTNAYALREPDIDVFREYVDLVGLPLDGPDPITHGLMRDDPRHFTIVMRAIQCLARAQIPIKINTVVGATNLCTILSLATLISDIQPKIWSVYEFWPIGALASANKGRFVIPPDALRNMHESICATAGGVSIEAGYIESRKSTYFFVGSDAVCYTISPDDSCSYVALGDVFDMSTFIRWAEIGYAIGNQQRVEHRRSLLASPSGHAAEPHNV